MAKGQCKNKECALHGQVEVPYAGNAKARIVWLGESPGYTEVKKGQPFIGKSGQLSRESCVRQGLNWQRMFIMNAARCRIDKKDMGAKEITKVLSHCRTYVERALRALKPKVIIAAGDFAMRQVIRKSGITKARGQWVWSKEFDCWVLPIFHPAYILRNMALLPVFETDIAMVVDFVRNGYNPPEEKEATTDQYTDQPIPLKEGHVYGVDSETQGLDWTDPNHLCISFSVSDGPGRGANILLFKECSEKDSAFAIEWPRVPDGKKKQELVPVYVKAADGFREKMEYLKELLENPAYRIYMMNGNFDWHVFKALFRHFWRGHELTITSYLMDVQAAANLVEENIYKLASLDFLQQTMTPVKFDYNGEFAKMYDKADMLTVPEEALLKYGAADADITRQVGVALKAELLKTPEIARYLVRFTMPTLQSLADMEEAGALVAMAELPEVQEQVRRLMLDAQKKAWANAPKNIKDDHKKKGLQLTRSDFVRDVLFHEEGYHLKPVAYTKAKQPKVDKHSRAELMDRRIPKKARDFLAHYSEWSEFNTLYTRYLKGFAKSVKTDGRIHTHYSVAKAVTGRIASSDPNLMNIPKRSANAKLIRQLITAPPGYKLLAIDESQSELRWMSHVAQDREMQRIFRSGELDIHTETAKSLYAGDWSKLSKAEVDKERRNAKAVNFGLLYGMSVNGFVTYAKQEYGLELSQEQASAWVEIFFGKYGSLRRYHKDTIEFCREHGYVASLFGRRRRLPEVNSDDRGLRAAAERQAINHPIQSPSSDTVLIANNELRRKNLLNPEECRAILFIHDELVFEVKDNSRLIDYAKAVIHEMEHPPLKRLFGVEMSVPLVAEAKIGDNLARMEDLEV